MLSVNEAAISATALARIARRHLAKGIELTISDSGPCAPCRFPPGTAACDDSLPHRTIGIRDVDSSFLGLRKVLRQEFLVCLSRCLSPYARRRRGKLELRRVEYSARVTEYRIDRIDDVVLIVFGESRTR